MIEFHDYHPRASQLREEVLEGLSRRPKSISPKFFYDERGSQLFDRICGLDEYYPTRAETAILEENAGRVAELVGENYTLIEYGSGSSRKIRILLDVLGEGGVYAPIDISREHMVKAATRIAESYPSLRVVAVCADYTRPFSMPDSLAAAGARRVIFFPGSTIGNLSPEQAGEMLRASAELAGPGGAMLLGVDLKKDRATLEAAYNDSEGVTAAFNLNLLHHVNRELEADFDVPAFRHRAFYNEALGRIEMHLVSQAAQTVRLNGAAIEFAEGESIHTENSYKYSIEEMRLMACRAGFRPSEVWTDADGLFSLHYLAVG